MTRSFAFADLWELVAEQVPEREAVVCGDRRITYAELDERANRLANHLKANGVGVGDHVGLYLTNNAEYLEVLLAAYKLRAVPINVNYRYVEDELRYLFADAGTKAVVHDAEFTDRMAAIRDQLPELEVELALGPDYEAALAAADPVLDVRGAEQRRPLHPLHGRHDRHAEGRGVAPGGRLPLLHRRRRPVPHAGCHHDARGDRRAHHAAGLDRHLPARGPADARRRAVDEPVVAVRRREGRPPPRLARPPRRVARRSPRRASTSSPSWATPWPGPCSTPGTRTAATTCPRSSSSGPVGRRSAPRCASACRRPCPNTILADGFGSSETGAQGTARPEAGDDARAAFAPMDDTTVVLDEDHAAGARPGRTRSAGWPARATSRCATTATRRRRPRRSSSSTAGAGSSPATWLRWPRTGPSTCWAGGRAASTPAARRSSPRRSSRSCASGTTSTTSWSSAPPTSAGASGWPPSSSRRRGRRPPPTTLIEHCRAHLAGYKVPKQVAFVDQVVRSPAGKPDYRWAKDVVSG